MTAPASPTLFLVDGSALAYRSHFAFIRNLTVTRQGEVVPAIFGFTAAVLRILERENPTHLAVVFDTAEPTFRHVKYADYKATRQKMPDELVTQLAGIRAVLEAMAIPILERHGYEA